MRVSFTEEQNFQVYFSRTFFRFFSISSPKPIASSFPFLKQFNLIKSLAKYPGVVKDRNQLMDAMYGDSIYVDDRTIDSHIKRLRKKFKTFDSSFDQIRTSYGSGYSWRE